MEYLTNPDHALMGAKRILKKEGYMVISTSNLAWWLNRIVLLFGSQPYYTECSTIYNVGKLFSKINEPLSGHLRLYTLRALKQLLELHGYRVIKVRGLHLIICRKLLTSLRRF